jgi:MYXO-CTERM domain-containing protein
MQQAWVRWVVVAAVLGLAPARAAAETYRFVKGPYLQGLTSSDVVVRWQGSEGGPAKVVVEGPEGRHEASTKQNAAFHGVEVRSLQPATRYTYWVEAEGASSPKGSFTTAPDGNKPFSFVLYGDNRSDRAAHERVVQALLRTPSDLLVHTGDMVASGGSEGDWQTFFDVERPLLRDRCLFGAVGNHELVGYGAANFLRYFSPAKASDRGGEGFGLYYSVRWSNVRFFFLNAMAPWDSSRDREWLARELGQSAAEGEGLHRIAVMHHGPHSAGPHGPNAAFVQSGAEELLRSHGVELVLAGHDHSYERGEAQGLKYIVSGGGGAPIYQRRSRPSPATRAFEPTHHFVVVSVDGDEVKTEARRADGTTIESCRYARGEPWACSESPAQVAPPPLAPPPPGPAGSPGRACACSVPGAAPPSSLPPALALALLALGARRRSLLALGVASLLAAGCSTYARELARGERAYDDNDYDRAEALLRALEPDLDALTPDERVRYCYARGMSLLRASDGGPARGEARYWLSLASASLKAHPGALGDGPRARMAAALCDLDREAGCERPSAPEVP